MGADEDFDVTHRLTMLGVDKISIFAVDVEEVLEHAEDKARDGENLGKGPETELAGESDEKRNSQ